MFQDRLKKYRIRAKLTKSDMVKMLDLKYTTYDNYERGVAEPKIKILIKIANILNVSIDDLVGRTIKDKKEQIKTKINDILNISDIKYLKLIDCNENDITFGICGNDENFIHHATMRTKEFKGLIEMVKNDAQKTFKENCYDLLFSLNTTTAINAIQQQIKVLKEGLLTNVTDYEKVQMIDDCIEQIQELQTLKEQYKKRYNITGGIF